MLYFNRSSHAKGLKFLAKTLSNHSQVFYKIIQNKIFHGKHPRELFTGLKLYQKRALLLVFQSFSELLPSTDSFFT